MANLTIAVIMILIVGLASAYIISEKKKGTKCIGCPSGGNCCSGHEGHLQCSCGCHSTDTNK